jgi:hypothetical protein
VPLRARGWAVARRDRAEGRRRREQGADVGEGGARLEAEGLGARLRAAVALGGPARGLASAAATKRSGSWLAWARIAARLSGNCAVTSTQAVGAKPRPVMVSACSTGARKPAAASTAAASARWSAW